MQAVAGKQNYNLLMEREIERNRAAGIVPRLLLHACCAPCSSAVLERLSADFDITVLYYNPNISPREEHDKRLAELERLVREMPMPRAAHVVFEKYDPERFLEISRGLEDVPEGGERCEKCYRLRLSEAARCAAAGGFDAFTTTLSISPLKDAEKLNRVGAELAEACGVPYLFSDFKKKNGYRRSVELSAEYGLYRQDYCGCAFSRAEREKQKRERAERDEREG
ncbi:MAG: epoxyqueuosine reductase QueH [Lachnospiraceae bacterium]|nr:epoxyqueuosine reductase QueH [Lachnospiraceae bacterium]